MVQPKRNVKSTTKSKKKLIVICAAAVLFLVLIIGISTWNTWRPMNAEETRFAEYLNDKYGKEFVVRDIKTEGSGFAVKGFRKGEGYPKDDNNFLFTVSYSGTKNSSTDGEYADDYLTKLWGQQEVVRLKPSITGIFGQTPDYSIRISMSFAIQADTNGGLPTLDEMKEKYPGQISYWLNVSLHDNFTDKSAQHYDRARQLAQLLQNESNLNTRLGYDVYLTSSNSMTAPVYTCQLDHGQLEKVLHESDIDACFIKQGNV